MKRILLDQNIPHKVVNLLAPHLAEIAYERGWSLLKNGDLLTAAVASGFDILITADQSLRHQQNLPRSRLAVILLDTNRWPHIASRGAAILAAVETAESGSLQAVPCFRRREA